MRGFWAAFLGGRVRSAEGDSRHGQVTTQELRAKGSRDTGGAAGDDERLLEGGMVPAGGDSWRPPAPMPQDQR